MTKAEAKRAAFWDAACWIRGVAGNCEHDILVDLHGEDLPATDVDLKIAAFEEIALELERRSWPSTRRKKTGA